MALWEEWYNLGLYPVVGGHRSVTVTHADLTAAVNGASQAINIGDELPPNAIIVATEVDVVAAFSGGGATDVGLSLGTTGNPFAIYAYNGVGEGIGPGTDTAPISAPNGTRYGGDFGGEQMIITFDPDSSHTLLALTAGECIAKVWFILFSPPLT